MGARTERSTPSIRRVLVVRGAFEEYYEPAWVRALSELGVDAQLFDSHSAMSPGIIGRLERNVMGGFGVRRARRSLLRAVQDLQPDVVVIYQGHYFDAETVEHLKRLSFVVGYHNDDPFGPRGTLRRYRHLRGALPAYDGYHVYRDVNIAEAKAVGITKVALLMPYFIPWRDYPVELTETEKGRFSCDVVFVGHGEPDGRVAALEALAASPSIKLRVFGGDRSWRRVLDPAMFRRLGGTPHLSSDDYRMAIAGSRIVLAFLSSWNRDQYTRRCFEIPAQGAFMLAQRTDALTALFKEGAEAEFFDGREELLSKTEFYLRNDGLRRKIADRGRERVHKDGHDVISRMRQWLVDVQRWRDAKHE